MGSGSTWMALPRTQATILTTAEKRAEQVVDSYGKYEWYKSKDIGETGCLEWWKQHERLFPEVADIARRRLSTQRSSTCSERSFSKAGLIITNKGCF